MEEFVAFFENYKEWIFLALSVILSIPVGIFVNLITPPIDDYLKNRSLSSRERKKYILTTRYKELKNFKESSLFAKKKKPPIYLWLLVYPVVYAFFVTSFPDNFIDYSLLSISLYVIFFIITTYVLVRLSKDFAFVWDFANFNRYRTRVLKQLVELGANPQELDRIDKEIEEKKI